MRQAMQLMQVERERQLEYLDSDGAMGMDGGHLPPHSGVIHRMHRLLRGRYVIATFLALVAAAGGVIVGWRMGKKEFQSMGQIRVLPVLPKVLYADDDKGFMPMFDQFVDTQAALIHSQRVIDMAMENEGWQKFGRGNGPEAAQEFANNLSVVRKGELISVMFNDMVPDATQAAVKAVIEAYTKMYVEKDVLSGETRLNLLQGMLVNLQADMGAKRTSIMAISKESANGDLEESFKSKTAELNKIDAEINDFKMQLALLTTAFPTTKPTAVDPRNLTMAQIAAHYDPMVQAMANIRRAEERVELLRDGGKLDEHPEVVAAKSAIKRAQREAERIADEFRQKAVDGYVQLLPPGQSVNSKGETPAEVKQKLLQTQQLFEERRAEVLALSGVKVRVESLKAEEEQVKSQLEDVRRRIEQLQVESKMAGRITAISDGDRPVVARDDRAVLASAGGAGGVMLGFGLVLVVGLMDRRFRSPEDALASMSRNPMLGILPNLPDDLADPEQAALTAHFVHQIRTLLQIWEGSREKKVFSITSPVAGTGKTSLTLALGVSFAAADSRTLVIDCDLIGGGLTARAKAIVRRKIGQILQKEGLVSEEQLNEALKLASGNRGRLGEILVELGYLKEEDVTSALAAQQKGSVGLLDLIAGEDLDNCIAETGINGLSILPLGNARAAHASKISPQAMKRVIEACRNRFDTILIDTGPVPGSLEASVVATAVDGVILVVSRGEQRPLAEKSVQHLLSIGSKVAGVVFNRARSEDMSVYTTTLRTSVPQEQTARTEASAESVRFGPMAQAVAAAGLAENRTSPGNGNGDAAGHAVAEEGFADDLQDLG